jgi:hypothetical protein
VISWFYFFPVVVVELALKPDVDNLVFIVPRGGIGTRAKVKGVLVFF